LPQKQKSPSNVPQPQSKKLLLTDAYIKQVKQLTDTSLSETSRSLSGTFSNCNQTKRVF